MNLTALFLNNFRDETPMWIYYGNVNHDDRALIDEMMGKYMPKTRPGGGWNYWIIYESSLVGTYTITRFTWEDYSFYGTIEELDVKMGEYHEGFHETRN